MSYIGVSISPVKQSDLLEFAKNDQLGNEIGKSPILEDDGDGNPTFANNIVISTSGDVGNLGTAAEYDVGTTANTIPVLDSSGRYPDINGSQITDLNANNISSGTINTARLGSGTANSSSFLRGDNSWQTISVDSSSILSAIAGASAGSVGTYGFFFNTSGFNLNPGDTASGSQLLWASSGTSSSGTNPSGSWRCLGRADLAGEGENSVTLFVRTV